MRLPKKKISAAARRVLGLDETLTSSQVLTMAPSAHTISTRSAPLVPAPARTDTDSGAGAPVQVLGVLLSPTLNVKSDWLMAGCDPLMSIITPLIPRE